MEVKERGREAAARGSSSSRVLLGRRATAPLESGTLVGALLVALLVLVLAVWELGAFNVQM